MSRKDKITIAVVVLIAAAAIFLTIYKNNNNDNETSEQPSTVSIEDLDSSESSAMQSDDNDSGEEQQSADNIVSFSEEFLNVYYSIDSTETGIYDSVEHINNYQQYMTEEAKEEFAPTEDDGSTADQMSILRQMGACKIYVSEESENKAKVLCLVYVATEIEDQSPTDELLLIGLNLVYQDSQWLVDDIVINHNLYDLQAPYAEIFD